MPAPTRLLAAVLVPLAAAPALADPPVYTLEYLGPTLFVNDLNDAGWAVGQTISGALVSWAWSPQGGYQLLPPRPGAADTQVRDMNDAGVAVGSSGGQPVVWHHVDGTWGAPETLPFLPGYSGGIATAINDVGDIVGLSTAGFQKPTLFTAEGGPADLGALGFFQTPAAINDARQVCGADDVLDLDTGALETLPVPPGPPSFLWTLAADINERGQVCGQGVLATSLPDDRLPVRWTPETGWDQLMSLPTPYASATSLNELGDTGIAYLKAVHIDGEGLFSPSGRLAPSASGWDLGSGFAIEFSVLVNDRRQLLTSGWNDGLGLAGAVLLTPTNAHGDVDGDGVTGFPDLLAVLESWGTANPAADCTVDGIVGFADLVLVLANWG